MKFHPIKYRQPIIGDSRCALYSLANVFNDLAFLLYKNVGQMTTHNEENEFLRHYVSEVNPCFGHIEGLYPYAIVPNHKRIEWDWVLDTCAIDDGKFAVSLIDCYSNGDNAHTIAVLWFNDGALAAIDPQKNEIVYTSRGELFEAFHVVGVRFLYSTTMDVVEFSMSDFTHLFSTCSDEVCPPIPNDVAGIETETIRSFCRPQEAYNGNTAEFIDKTLDRDAIVNYRNIRHEVTFQVND